MGVPFDTDLFVLAASVASVFSSLPRLRSLPASRIPVQYDLQEVPPESLTEAQAKYLASYDEKLAAMNYLPVCTYRIANYGHNLIRNYVNPVDMARCVLMIMEIDLVKGSKPYPTNSCILHFHTRFADGTILTTRNMRAKSIMDQPPYEVVQERPGLSDPAPLKREHDRKAVTMGQPVAPPADAKSVFADIQSEHQRFSDFYLQKGDLSLDIGADSYTITDKVLSRAIRNHLNPFAQNLPMRGFLPAALVAIALPLLAITKLAPIAAHAALGSVFSPFTAGRLVILASYLVAGAILGYLLENNTFLWTLLLTYLAFRVPNVLPFGSGPFATIAATVAYSVARAKKHRGTVLLLPAQLPLPPNALSSTGNA